ncbi:jerky protein [Biomphalaria glabrata]|nr:jerky protein homolog-like [Biomphalaria glabrata]KAI8747738.1 jerky protein [Biomphalaria glabrata]
MDLVSVIVGTSEDSEESSPTEGPRRPARKHRWLSIQEKVELLRKLDLSVPVQEICKLYGIGSSTVYDLRKQREQILEFHANSECSKLMRLRKTMRNSRSAEHDRAMVDWYRKQRASGVHVTGSRIVARAREVHQELKLSHDCTYSEGWLQRFKKRHGIVMTKVCRAFCFTF